MKKKQIENNKLKKDAIDDCIRYWRAFKIDKEIEQRLQEPVITNYLDSTVIISIDKRVKDIIIVKNGGIQILSI